MNTRRLERLAILLVVLGTACTLLPNAHTPAHAETRLVTIPGENADTLAETTGPVEDALVPVHTHDGRDLWVREATLGGAMLVPGTWIIIRSGEYLATASVTRSLDAFVEVDVAGTSSMIPIGDVLARLHRDPTPVAVADPPPEEPPAPLTPIVQMVALETAHTLVAASVAYCREGIAHVVLADGTDTDVALSDVHPMRLRAGDHVVALWNDMPYPARVTDVRSRLAHVQWDDGSAQWVDFHDVQSVDGESGLAVQGCPHHTVLVDRGGRTSIGRIIACEGSSVTILGSDGSSRSVPHESVDRVPLRVGDAIEARWNGNPYDATVISIGDRIHIRWYDTTEADIDPADLVSFRTRDVRAREPASCPHVG
jgi:hypothetical protein